MKRPARHRAIVVGVAAASLLGVAQPAFAQDDEILLIVPVSGVHFGDEGSSLQVASVAVPAELVGQSCEIFGSTVNQSSIHPGNDLLIVNGDESFTIPNFEDEGDIVRDAGDVETLGASIQLFVVFGPDGASSGGFRVTVRNCVDIIAEPTTTQVPTTTVPVEATPVETTTPETTTPETTTPETVPTQPETSDTTEVDPAGPIAGPSTTAPVTSVTEAPATTTTAVATTRATVAPDPLGPTETGSGSLPVTGSPTGWIVASGVALAVAGTGIARSARLRTEK